MNVLLISYDLINPGQNYAALIQLIKSTGTWAKPLESTWLVKTSDTPKGLYDRLSSVLDRNDKILIMNITKSDYYGALLPEVNNWMSQNLG